MSESNEKHNEKAGTFVTTAALAGNLAEDFERRKAGKPRRYDRVVALVGAGMGYETHLPLGNEAIARRERRLVPEYAIEGMSDIGTVYERLAQTSFISKETYEAALNDLKQGTGISGIGADFEMCMEALCQGHAMETAVR